MKRRHVITLLVLIGLAWLGSAFIKGPQTGSTYHTTPSGARALFEVLQHHRAPVELWFHHYGKLDLELRDAVLFVVAPEKLGSEAELLNWVRQGNHLVFFEGDPSVSIALRSALHVIPASERRLPTSPWEKEKHPSAEFRCPAQSPLPCEGVQRISTEEHVPRYERLGDGSALVDHDHGARALYFPLGDGTVWYFTSPHAILNRNIDLHDNFDLLYGLATGAQKILFDEFHHGYTAPVTAEIERRSEMVYLALVCLAAWLLISVFSRGVRFGPPVPEPAGHRSAAVDFVSALGILYAERRAASVLKHYLTAWRRRAETRFGISRYLSQTELLDELRARRIIDDGQLNTLKLALQKISEATDYSAEAWENSVRNLEGVLTAEASKRSEEQGGQQQRAVA